MPFSIQTYNRRRNTLCALSVIGFVVVAAIRLKHSPMLLLLRARDAQNSNESLLPEVKPYNAASSMLTNESFGHKLMLLAFHPGDGTLKTYGDYNIGYNKYDRAYSAAYILSHALLQNFPERFEKGQRPFHILFTNAPLPPLAGPLLEQCRDEHESHHHGVCRRTVEAFAPIITFGSAPRDTSILPTLHQLPLTNFMSCFESASCTVTMPFTGVPEWDGLKSQIIWRGTDYPTAAFMGYEDWVPGHSYQEIDPERMSKEEVIRGLLGHYDTLTPRWRAVVQSLKASLDAEEKDGEEHPWIDAKFVKNPSSKIYAEFDPILERYEMQGVHVEVDQRMDEREMAGYKYQLDIGGGGGTTWEGTLRKLAMPGLLFHHETPTKDFFFDEIKPWVHFVPIRFDLFDLRQKFEWAESHPEEAQKIAKAGTDYINQMTTDEWIGRTYDKFFAKELGQIVDACYQLAEGETAESIVGEYEKNMVEFRKSMGQQSIFKIYTSCETDGCTISNPQGEHYKAFGTADRSSMN